MKTLKEKAIDYAEANVSYGMSKEMAIRAYIAGATEALAGQWHDAKTDPPPFGERIICASLDVRNEIKYLRIGERVGEDNYRDWEDEYSYIGCDIWMYAPEPPKPSDQ